MIGVGVIGIGFAVVFAVGAVLTYRGSRFVVPLVGVLVLVEVAAWPTFTRDTPSDWIIQVPFLIVGLVGLSGTWRRVFRGTANGAGESGDLAIPRREKGHLPLTRCSGVGALWRGAQEMRDE